MDEMKKKVKQLGATVKKKRDELDLKVRQAKVLTKQEKKCERIMSEMSSHLEKLRGVDKKLRALKNKKVAKDILSNREKYKHYGVFHLIFILDTSKSMLIGDILPQTDKFRDISPNRLGSAMESISYFIQLQSKQSRNDIVSLVTFDSTYKKLIVAEEVNEKNFISALTEIKIDENGSRTLYAQGFLGAEECMKEAEGKAHSTVWVFVSDGSPEDKQFDDILETMKNKISPNFFFQGLGICPDYYFGEFLKNIVRAVDGIFISGGNDGVDLKDAFESLSDTLTVFRTMKRGKKIKLELGHLATKYEDTKAKKKTIEFENFTDMSSEDGWDSPIKVKRYEVAFTSKNVPQWLETDRKVRIRKKPFSKGAMRVAYIMEDITDDKMVIKLVKKESLFENQFNSGNFHQKDVICQMIAKRYAEKFNNALLEKKQRKYFICYVPSFLFQYNDKFFVGEPLLPEGEFTKYNVNSGQVLKNCITTSCFSHFTFHHSEYKNIVLDIQGIQSLLTDPQICSLDKDDTEKYGAGNIGEEAIKGFAACHNCNALCKTLELENFKTDVYVEENDTIEKTLFCCENCLCSYEVTDKDIDEAMAKKKFVYLCKSCKSCK